MKYVGVDLHKQVLSACVVVVEDGERKVAVRRSLRCKEPEAIETFFAQLAPFQVVVEASASYEWFVELVDPLADRVILAHPKKLRVIAESTRKTDKLDAQILAEFLALDMIPEAHRSSPRVRELADLAPKGAASGVTIGAVFFLLLTIDFKSSAEHTRSTIDLQKRVSALEDRLSEGSKSQS